MSVLAAIRPDDWNFPLLVHVFGAMVLVGGLTAAVTSLVLGWRRDTAAYTRVGFWSLLAVAFPSWWLMRLGGEWIRSKEGFGQDDDPTWLDIGYTTADLGGLLLLLSIVLAGLALRRLRNAERGGTSVLARVSGVLAVVVLAAYVVAVWAMSAKPN